MEHVDPSKEVQFSEHDIHESFEGDLSKDIESELLE